MELCERDVLLQVILHVFLRPEKLPGTEKTIEEGISPLRKEEIKAPYEFFCRNEVIAEVCAGDAMT